MCKVIKCATPECNTKMKSCKLRNGKCPSCYKKEQALKNIKP